MTDPTELVGPEVPEAPTEPLFQPTVAQEEPKPSFTLPAEISKTKPVFLVHPETQKTFAVSNAEKAQALVDSGWGPETKDQLLQRVTKDVVRDQPILSGVAAFTGQFTNQALMGIPQAVHENIGDEGQDAQARQLDKTLAEEHPVLNIAGGIAGTAATLLLTPLGKAFGLFGDSAVKTVQRAAAVGGATTAKAAASKVVETAVKFGAENAALSIPYRITEETLGDPAIASEGILAHTMNVASGVVHDATIGAGLGAGVSLLGSTIKSAANIASGTKTTDFLREKSRYFQFKNTGALNPQFKQLEAVTQKLDRPGQIEAATEILDEHAGPIAQFLGPGAIEKKLVAARQKIGNTLNTIRNTADATVPGGAVKFKDVANGLDQLEIQYSKGIAPASSMPIDYSQPGAIQAAVKKFGGDPAKWPTHEKVPGIVDPRATPDLKAIQYVRESWQAEGLKKLQAQGMSKAQAAEEMAKGNFPKFTLNEAHNFRQSVKEKLFQTEKANGIITDAGRESFAIVRDVMDKEISNIAKSTGNPALSKSLKDTNREWQKLHPFIKHIITPAATAAGSRNKIGLTAVIGALGGPIEFGLAMTKRFLGNYMMYQSLGAAASVLESQTGKIASSIAGSLADKASVLALPSVNVWSRYTGEKEIEPRRAFAKIQNDLNLVQANPQAVADSLSGHTPDLAEFAPKNYAAMAQTTQNAVKYLKDVAPKPPAPLYPGGPIRPWQPSDAELSRYSRRLNAVMDPLSILDEIKTGTLSRESVEAVRAVYPNLLTAVQTEIKKKMAMAPPEKVHAMRQKLSLILENTEDPTGRAVRLQGLQAGFAPNNNQVKPRANSKIDESGRYETPLSRISK